MPSLKDTKRRIVSVKSTKKITRAMKLVSSAKYARANRAILNSQPYYNAFHDMLGILSAEDCGVTLDLLDAKPESKALLIVVSTDRGLCGGLNSNLFKKCASFIEEKKRNGCEVSLGSWGKRAIMYAHKSSLSTVLKESKVLDKPSFASSKTAANHLANNLFNKEFDRVYIAYAGFKNTLTQIPKVEQLLPIEIDPKIKDRGKDLAQKVIFEPSRVKLLRSALEVQLASKIYQIILNSATSEHAARMAAMDNATSNADQVISTLTIQYNRARQAAITKELIEITSGAEAL